MKKIISLSITVLCTLYSVLSTHAANRFWIAGSTANWNSTANWSTTSGGSGGASVPGSSDVAKFDGNGTGSCTIDATVNVAGVDIASGYSGTISQGSYAITVGSSSFTMAGGTFTGGAAKIDVNGLFTLSGGTFTATSDTLFNGGSICSNYTVFTHSGGTFNNNSGTVVFDPYCYESTYTIDVISSTHFNNVKAAHSVALKTNTGDTLKIDGNLYHYNGDLGGFWDLKGNLKVYGYAAGNYQEGQIIFSGTGSQTYEYLAGRTVRIKINKSSGTVTPASGTTALMVQGFILAAGSFTAPSGNFNIGARACTDFTIFNHSGGTFNHNSGTIIFDPSCWDSNYIIDLITSSQFNNVKAAHALSLSANTGDTIKIAGNLHHYSGDLGGIWDLKGNLKVDGYADGTYKEGQIIFSSTDDQTYEYAAGRTVRIKINKSSGTVTPASGTTALKVQGFIMAAGSFTAPSGEFNIGGRACSNLTIFNHSGGSFNHNSGTVVFANSCWDSSYIIDLITSSLFNNVKAAHALTLNVNTGDTLKMEGNFNHNNGDLGGIWDLKGNLKVDGSADGTYQEGQIIFSGTGSQTYEYIAGRTVRIKINKSSGTVSPASGTTDLKVQGFILAAGTFTAPSGDFNIGGRACTNLTIFNHSGGTFTHNNGKVTFNTSCWSSNYTIDVIPSTRFYKVTDNHQGDVALSLASGDSLHVENEMKFLIGNFNTGVIAAEGKVIVNAANTAQLLFCGTSDQDFDLTGATNAYNGNIKINKPSGKINLLSAAVLDQSSQTLTFVKGNIVSTASNLLTIGHGVTVSGASDISYVDGPVKKVGTAAFTFPVGKSNHYRQIGISAPSSSTDAYTAEYFIGNSNNTYLHTSKDGSIAKLSRNEYWTLDRNTGATNVSVTLSWDDAVSCTIDNTSNVKVCVWDGSLWKDKSNGSTTGDIHTGTVTSSSTIGTFGMYTLGTSGAFGCSTAVYTWNGATSTAWATASNWTPSGVPGPGDDVTIVSASNNPVNHGAAGVEKFTMTSGTLDLNGYTLPIGGTATFNGGTINNGRVNATGSTSTFAGTTFGAVVWVNSSSIGISNSVFNDSLLAMKTGSSNNNFDGLNKFKGYTKIENSGTGYIRTAVNGPDTFNLKSVFNNTGGGIYIGNSFGAINSVFNDDIIINNTSSAGVMSFGYAHPAYINGNVELNNTSTGGISFSGKNYLASGKTITIGSTGFTAGTLALAGIKQAGTQKHVFNLPSGTTLVLGTGNSFNGVFEGIAPSLNCGGSVFNDSLHLVKNGSSNNSFDGMNKFNGYTKIENSGTGYITTAVNGPDTFNLKSVFNNTGGGIYIGNSFGAINSVFNDDIIINNTSSAGAMSFGYAHPAYINGNVELNNTSTGGISFSGKNYLASGKTITIGSTGFTSGSLNLAGIKQQGTEKHVFSMPSGTSLNLGTGNNFKGVFECSAPSITVFGNIFNDSLHLVKNGSGTNIPNGGNKFKGYAKIENTGTGTLAMSHYSPDTFSLKAVFNNTNTGNLTIGATFTGAYTTFNNDLELNNTGSTGNISFGYASPGYLNGNVVLNNTSSGYISFAGQNYLASGKTITIGSTGFTSGSLNLGGIKQQGTEKHVFSMPSGTSLNLGTGNNFKGVFECSAPSITVFENIFNDSLHLVKNGSGTNIPNGGNKFKGYAKIENTGTGTLAMSHYSPDTFSLKAVFNNTNTGNLTIGATFTGAYTTFNNDLELNNIGSTGNISFGYASPGYLNGNVVLNNTSSGYISFAGQNYLASGKTITIGSTGFTSGSLNLGGIKQAGNAAISMSITGNSISIGDCTWGGPFTASAPNIYNTGTNKFAGKVIITKTSNTANTWSGGNKFSDSLIITNTGTSYVLMANGVGADTLLGHLKLNNTSSGTIYAGYNYNNLYYGNITVSQNVNFANSTGVAILKGSTNQTFTRLDAGSTPTDFKKLTIDKTNSSNTFTLNNPIGVSSVLTLTKGNIVSSSTNVINLADNATVSGVSNNSYVDGPFKKTGNDAFTFPVGKNGYYRKIGISAPSSTTDAFTAEYFTGNSSLYHSHGSRDGAITQLSRSEYWNLDRTTGSTNVSVTLSWDSAVSCTVDNVSNVKVCVWDGSLWKDKGNSSTTGNIYIGTVTSSSTIGTFGLYSLGTSGVFGCDPYSYTWNGSTSSTWNTFANWTPNGYPQAEDNVTIVTASHQPSYDGVEGLTNLTMTSGTLDLNTYTLPLTGVATFNGGTINNGKISTSGSSTVFAGTTFGAKVVATSPTITFAGTTFNDSLIATAGTSLDMGTGSRFTGITTFSAPDIYNSGPNRFYSKVKITKTSNTPNTWSGGNFFDDSLTITNTGTSYIRMANSTPGDTLSGNVVLNNTSTGAIFPAYTGNNTFSGNIVLKGSGMYELGKGGGAVIMDGGNGKYIRYMDGTVTRSFTVDKPGDYTTMFKRLNISNDFMGKMWGNQN